MIGGIAGSIFAVRSYLKTPAGGRSFIFVPPSA